MLPNFLEQRDPDIYFSDNYVVLDWETDTSHGDYGSAVHEDNGLLLGSWREGPSGRLRSRWSDEYGWGGLVEAIEKADFLVAHNAKYELMWLKRCGLDLTAVVVFDTKIAEYVLLGNKAAGDDKGMRPMSTSLDMCCRRRGWPIKDPVVDTMISNGINPVSIPRPWLQGRCEQDVVSTEKLFLDQREHLSRTGRLPVLFTRGLLTPVLSALEFTGMHLCGSRVGREYEDYSIQINQLNHQLEQLTGGINWRSGPQVADYIYGTLGFLEFRKRSGEPIRTASGRPKTDQDTLAKLKAKTKEQKEFIILRKEIGKVASALSKNLEFFKGVVDEQDGTFKAVFNQTRTATHRLSSSGIPTLFSMFDKPKTVQFQNLPRVFKPLFKARNEGWLMAEADGSQLEFRVAAHLGKDEAARKLIVEGGDVHELSTKVQFDMGDADVAEMVKAKPQVWKGRRTASKPWTFRPLYGGEGRTSKQKKYAAEFRKAYPDLARAQKVWCEEVLNTKRLVTPWGLRYYWPKSRMVRRGKDHVLNVKSSVFNYPVQALATAEIIPIAVVFFWHRVMSEGLADRIRLVNTIHDSIICELHPSSIDDFKRIAKQAFTADVYEYLEEVYGIKFDFVPLGVGINVGEYWTEGKEESYNIYYDGIEERVE